MDSAIEPPPKSPAERRQPGGQPGNVARLRHGLRSGSLPRGASYIARQTDELRQALEASTLTARGEVSLLDACAINTAVRAERLAMLAQCWLRLESDKLAPEQKLAFAREVVRASEARDRAIRELRLSPAEVAASQAAQQRQRLGRLLAKPAKAPASPATAREPAGPSVETPSSPNVAAGQPEREGPIACS